jgi:photosystem II stability/assembly factor-like uncharacterized protein
VLLALGSSAPASAHDASAWGGLFRTRDGGDTWFQASSGKVMGGAVAIAVDPRDSAHLLLGTDSGLLGSRNGGRDWDRLAPDLLAGPVLALAFDTNGETILAATRSALAVSTDGTSWRSLVMPVGASPPRALVADAGARAFFLLGWQGVFHSDDAGTTWSPTLGGVPAPVTQLLVDEERAFALAGGELWQSRDARAWSRVPGNLPPGRVQTLAVERADPTHMWAGAANRVYQSVNSGETWTALGRPLFDADIDVHAIVASTGTVVVSTSAGLYESTDQGASWSLLADNLPGHIEAGPLVRDASQPGVLYAGFSVTPYAEIWQNAATGSPVLARLGGSEVVGAAAFMTLLGMAAVFALRALAAVRT